MEWVETTGNTLDAAKEAALDELGVDEQDAEFEVLQEAKTGLFGRVRAEARIRARVRPTAPRAKEDRRDRRRSRTKEGGSEEGAAASDSSSSSGGSDVLAGAATAVADRPTGGGDRPRRNGGRGGRAGSAAGGSTSPAVASGEPAESAPGITAQAASVEVSTGEGDATEAGRSGSRNRRGGRGRGGAERANGTTEDGDGGAPRSRSNGRGGQSRSNERAGEGPTVEVALEEQGRVAEEFLQGLLAQFGLEAEIAIAQPDDDNVELAITGSDLGLLIGPKGATLLAIQDLTRTVVQRKTSAGNGRVHVDVSGYREKRAAALSGFARQVASQVVATGERKALEPMASPDRKVVHDALTDFEGVDTLSEGEDPRRRVVIVPAS